MSDDLCVFDQCSAPSGAESHLRHSCCRGQGRLSTWAAVTLDGHYGSRDHSRPPPREKDQEWGCWRIDNHVPGPARTRDKVSLVSGWAGTYANKAR